MQVLKFGGSSVANAENIEKVVNIIQRRAAGKKTIVVVSALGGITDTLLNCGTMASLGNEDYKDKLQEIEARHIETVKTLIPVTQQSRILSHVKTQCNELEDIFSGIFLLRELSPTTKDRIVSYGELLSSQILVSRLTSLGMDAEWKDARDIITTDSNHTSASVDFAATNTLVYEYFSKDNHAITVVPGFIASDINKRTTTLGRGGSDYTAAIIAAAIHTENLEIWTDVSGMMTADPRLVPTAKAIPRISYQEAMELSHFGAKVIYPPTIQPVMKKEIAVWIKNTFCPDAEGTLIENVSVRNGKNIRGISSVNEIVLLSLEGSGMIGIPGFSKRLFEALAQEKINVILITQGSSEHSICVGIDQRNADVAKQAIDQA
ncbi:MAG TPA: aspartate kinase, partial [Segetibacter sp.]